MAVPYVSSFDVTIPFSDTCAQIHIPANTVVTYTVPGTANQKVTILFEYASDSNVYVGYNVTPAIPGSAVVTDDSFVEYKPASRYAKGADVISFITPDTVAYFGLSVRGIPSPRT